MSIIMGWAESLIRVLHLVILQVSEQQVCMEVLLRRQLLASLNFNQVRVNDGEWHHLLVELRSIKDGKDIKYIAAVSLDYGMHQVQGILQHKW